MKTEFLKKLGLNKNSIDCVMAENGKDIQRVKIKADNLQTKIDTLQGQLNQANRMIHCRNQELVSLKNSYDNSQRLKATILDLQNDNRHQSEIYAKEIYQTRVDYAIQKALINAKAKNFKAVKALLNLGHHIEFNHDGTIKNLDEKILELKKTDPYLFEEDTIHIHIQNVKPSLVNPLVSMIEKESHQKCKVIIDEHINRDKKK